MDKEFSGERTINSVTETTDGNLVVVGTKQATPEINTVFTSKLGPDGITKAYTVLYETDKQYTLQLTMLTSDGGVIASGQKFPAGSSPEEGEPYLLKLNQNGEQEWQKTSTAGTINYRRAEAPNYKWAIEIGINFSLNTRTLQSVKSDIF